MKEFGLISVSVELIPPFRLQCFLEIDPPKGVSHFKKTQKLLCQTEKQLSWVNKHLCCNTMGERVIGGVIGWSDIGGGSEGWLDFLTVIAVRPYPHFLPVLSH